MKTLVILFCTVIANPAYAYVGPGLGAGTIGLILGVVGSIAIALFAILWYPFKRLLKKMRKSPQGEKR